MDPEDWFGVDDETDYMDDAIGDAMADAMAGYMEDPMGEDEDDH